MGEKAGLPFEAIGSNGKPPPAEQEESLNPIRPSANTLPDIVMKRQPYPRLAIRFTRQPAFLLAETAAEGYQVQPLDVDQHPR